MGLERVHRKDTTENFGPVRLGPQDLRDISAVFGELDANVDLALSESRTAFMVGEHQTDNIEDVLAFADADTLPAIHIISAELRLSFHAAQSGTSIMKPWESKSAVERQVVEEAADKLRQIIESRQLKPIESLRQRGPGKWLLVALLSIPALALALGQPVLELWFSPTTSQAIAAVIVWLTVILIALVHGRAKDLIRLRGQEMPWWERRQGLIALVGVGVACVIPFVIYALERAEG